MAKRGQLSGAVRGKSQVYNPITGKWVKRGENGRFESVKKDGSPYKNVRKEK